MRSLMRISIMAGIMACAASVWGAPGGQDPYIGYVYPAGGQQGSSFEITIRGQRLRNADVAYISGQGVHASVVGYEGASGPLNILQQEELKRRLEEIRNTRFGGFGGNKQGKAATKLAGKLPGNTNTAPVELPDLPELRNLEQQTPMQLKYVMDKFLNRAKRPKPPIAEMVTLKVDVDADAVPGDRMLRLRTSTGLTNPLVFQIGRIPEIRERSSDDTSEPSDAKPPVVLNGRIMPGEVDRFPLQLKGGQKLVIAVQARKLIPYLADAVPGWFQAAAALRDADGKEVAYDDDCGFDPDPAFIFRVPHDGKYILEIKDALYRGREDFVYRVDVCDETAARQLFPSGSRGGVLMGAANSDRELSLKMAKEHFGFTDKPVNETEPNDTGQTSMRVTMPHIINGTITAPGDRDVFRIKGRAGDVVVAEVYARRMGSPLDSMLRLIDTSGRVVASNDDFSDKQSGLLTHQADSYLSAKLPATGDYFVQVSDAQRHGGPQYNYSLRIGAPKPDFALLMTPSSLNIPAGRAVTATVYAVRKDGWTGDIDVILKDAPIGFTLSGARIPKGRDHVRITLAAPRGRFSEPIVLHLEGRAEIGGKVIARPVMPTDDMEQAFAYHHLVPSDELMVMVPRGALMSPNLDMQEGERLRIPAGGTAQVSFTVRPAMPNAQIHIELNNPPAGVTLQDVKTSRREFTLTLKADDKHTGYADNLIAEAFTEISPKQKTGGAGQKQRVSLGVMPAVAFEIVEKGSLQ